MLPSALQNITTGSANRCIPAVFRKCFNFSAMPQNMFTFPGNVTDRVLRRDGAELRTGNTRVRVSVVSEGIFQVRMSQSGDSFENPPFSYAVRPGFHDQPVPDVTVALEEDPVLIRNGSFTAVVACSPLRVRFEDTDGYVFAADDYGPVWNGNSFAVWKKRADDEYFFGLGEKAYGINRTEERFKNWNTDAPFYRRESDPLYKSFPFFIGLKRFEDGVRRAYGIYLDNSYRSEFDFGGQARQHVVFGAEGGALNYYVFMGPEVTDVIRRYTELTGRMPMPPRWSLGYQQSRWSYYPAREVRTLVQQFRERKIPLDVVHLDIHYMDGYRIFTWDKQNFPDPAGLIHDLREQGVKTVVIIDPGVKTDPGYPVYDEGLAADAFVKFPDGRVYEGSVWPGACHFPDFTKPGARAWFGGYYKDLLEKGIAGIWTDMNEPSNHRYKTIPDLVLHDFEGRGGTHQEAHNIYGLMMTRATYEALREHAPDERPFVLTRSAFSGSQRYAAAWTGDNVSNWDHLRLTIPMLLSMGISGMPFCGSDVGGFLDSPTPELFARWVQLGAFSPLFRNHTIFESQRQEPWSFGPRVEEISRRFIELRYRLLPLFYSLFDEHRRTGLPLMRPLFLHYPQDEKVLFMDDQFMLGEHLLIAPVLHKGATARQVYLPEGRWYDFWSGTTFAGGRETLVEARLEDMPVFVRAGGIVPMGPLMQYSGEKTVEELELRAFVGDGEATLYEDDDQTHAYEQGMMRRTTFEMREPAPGLCSIKRTSAGPFRSLCRSFRLHLPGVDRPHELRVDRQPYPILDASTSENAVGVAIYTEKSLTFSVDAGFENIEIRWT